MSVQGRVLQLVSGFILLIVVWQVLDETDLQYADS